jgi:hypothetical protein
VCVENLPAAVDNAYTMRMARPVIFLAAAFCLAADCPAQAPRTPDLAAQRAAMGKLSFLVGRWSGAASALRAGGMMDLAQTEEAQCKLDGLLLMIEGVGRAKADGRLVLQAFGLISFDGQSGTGPPRKLMDLAVRRIAAQ